MTEVCGNKDNLKTGEFFAEVVIPPLDGTFTYTIPQEIAANTTIGSLVEVPFNRRVATGFLVNLIKQPEDKPSYIVKPISRLISKEVCFSADELILYNWIADYYCAPLSYVINTAVPEYVPSKESKCWYIVDTFEKSKLKGKKQQQIF